MNPLELGPQRESDRELLIRIDERTKNLNDAFSRMTETFVTKEQFQPIKDAILLTVTRTEFAPIQKIVYGAAGLILVGVFTALIGLVVMK